MDLVGSAEIARLLGVTRQRIDQLAGQPGFPKPVGRVSGRRVWDRAEVLRWAQDDGRLSGPCG